MQPGQSGGSGDGFPSFAMGGCNISTPNKKYNMSRFTFGGGENKTSKEINSNNNSTCKCKSPHTAKKGEGNKDASMESWQDGQITPLELLADVKEQMKKIFFPGD
jgi:hypothetical protein